MNKPLTANQVAKLLGFSYSYVLGKIKSGSLQATLLPARPGLKQMRYRISHRDLAKWMVASDIPLDLVRSALYQDGYVLLVRTDPALQAEMGKFPTKLLPSLFHLGKEIEGRRGWAVVVDLPAVGTEEACKALGGYAAEYDRPELIGIHGDEDTWNRKAAEVFDILLPKAAGPQHHARAIARLRSGVSG